MADFLEHPRRADDEPEPVIVGCIEQGCRVTESYNPIVLEPVYGKPIGTRGIEEDLRRKGWERVPFNPLAEAADEQGDTPPTAPRVPPHRCPEHAR